MGATPTTYPEKEHIGLLVYNVTDTPACPLVEPGMYVWDGVKWKSLATPDTSNDAVSETSTTLTDRDGNVYPIHTFGTAGTWMVQNLRTVTTPDGTALENSAAWPTQAREKRFAYPSSSGGGDGSNDVTFQAHPEYGLLYNWYATTDNRNCGSGDQSVVPEILPDQMR